MYVGYTNSFSVHFFVLLNSYVCRWSKIFGMWIVCLYVLTIGTMTKPQPSWMGEEGTPPNCGQGLDLTACLVGLLSHLWSHWGRCSTRTGPNYVGSLVCTESLRMYVVYTNSFSIRFLSIPTILYISYLLKYISYLQKLTIRIELANDFFSWKSVARAPLGARAYSWILSKYFPSIRPCVRPSPYR
jgi:hypothetical protein